MSEAKVLIKRRRRSIGALTMLLGALMAVGSLFFAATVASAHHPEFSASRLCDGSWTARADYVDGSEERLIILSGVTINGVPLTAGQTAGFVPYDPAVHGVTEPPASGLAWKGASPGFTIFNLAGSDYSGGWSGSITVYRPIGDVWFVGHSASVYAPDGPTDCETSTPTPTNTVPPTATATATIVDHTATPTKTTPPANTPTPTKTTPPVNTPTPTKTAPPANTPTPTKTTPPCTPPGTQTPTGGTTCTPTPTNTVPPTATPTTPPCTPPGTQTPTGGSTCTPTPPPATATSTTPPPATNTPPAGCYNGGGTPPTGAVVCTPTPVDSVAGVKTPGPGVPSAGTGFTGDLSSTNMVFALLGLLAVTAGAAFMAMGRTADDE